MTDAPDPDADRYAYSRTAPARIALSAEPRELADRATAGVPAPHDMWALSPFSSVPKPGSPEKGRHDRTNAA
ncbi:hypothetical protein [Streptomyces sp. CCM_MD2014]|uniref:hypothetical protein n=1 Tax=Streptomyces sp. CCM_MD2014 TaxID=1561022 RepID=UPI00052A3A69|nr:hypothetical protein [Streptomyces sp. CCM_MD2014]AIV38379.1 hypothetical protein NI25_36625 [Streptomyces sp. CCM_MD2014]